MNRRRFMGMALCALVAGCGSEKENRKMIRWAEASKERRMAFAETLRTALRAHEDLYDKRIDIRIEVGKDGKPQVSVHAEALVAKVTAEKAVQILVTNFSLNHPGIGFQEIGEGVWQILLPDEMPIEAEGNFELKTFETT